MTQSLGATLYSALSSVMDIVLMLFYSTNDRKFSLVGFRLNSQVKAWEVLKQLYYFKISLGHRKQELIDGSLQVHIASTSPDYFAV